MYIKNFIEHIQLGLYNADVLEKNIALFCAILLLVWTLESKTFWLSFRVHRNHQSAIQTYVKVKIKRYKDTDEKKTLTADT